MKISSDSQYREYKRAVEVLIEKGTKLGDIELLSDSDKEDFARLTDAIYEWEAAYHPLPGKVSTIITDAIKKCMDAENIKQKEAAQKLGISESRISELLSGKRALNLNIWEDSALVANILAIISFALNRVYTEFYRSRGYDFDITSSTAIDQKFINGRNIFENVGRLVDELFNTYLRRQGFVEPLAAKFCNGTTVTCDGLSQWGSQELAQQGLSSVEILRRYYGEDIEIVRNAPMRGYAPSYGGTPLRRGSRGPQVVQLQVMLNRIGQSYPAIPRVASVDGIFGTQTENAVLAAQRIFNLDPDGIVGKGTWYQLVRLYVAVTELSALASQGQTFYAVNWQYSRVLREGSTGEPVRVLQYMLQVIGSYINDVPMPPQTGIFGELTANSVRAFQRFSGLAIDGIVGEQTWNAIFDRLAGIAETGPLPQDVAQEIAEEVGYLVQAGVIPNFPGQILRLGDSDT